MSFGVRGLLAAAVMLFVAGCNHAKPTIPFDSSVATPVKTIGLLTPGYPGGPHAVLGNTIGKSFGLIGFMIDSGMQEARDTDLENMLKIEKFSANDSFHDGMKAALEAKGYKVVDVPFARENAGQLQKSYGGINQSGVDAYLDTTFVYGFLSAGVIGKAPYRPYISLQARMVKASDSSVLMEDRVVYSPLNQKKDHISVSPDPKYAFDDFDALMADPKLATEGLGVAFKATTAAAGQLMQ